MVLLFNNSKGGVAKTSSVIVIAQILSAAGYKTLIVDLDPQGNAASMLRAEETTNIVKKGNDGYEIVISNQNLLTDELSKKEVESFVRKTDFLDLEVIPSNEEMYDVIYDMHNMLPKKSDIFLTLKKNLDKLDEYDYIIIDSSPFRSHLIDAAVCAADRVYVPVEADNLSYEGLRSITNHITKMNETYGLEIELGGVFITKANKRTIRFRSMFDGYESQFGDIFIPVAIRQHESVSKAATAFIPLLQLDKQCPAITDYIELCNYEGLIDKKHYRKLTKYLKNAK